MPPEKLNQIDHHVRYPLALFLGRRRGLRYRHPAVPRSSFDWFRGLGLYRLFGTIRYPGLAQA